MAYYFIRRFFITKLNRLSACYVVVNLSEIKENFPSTAFLDFSFFDTLYILGQNFYFKYYYI